MQLILTVHSPENSHGFGFLNEFIQVSVHCSSSRRKPASSELAVFTAQHTELLTARLWGSALLYAGVRGYRGTASPGLIWFSGDFPKLPFSVSFLLVKLKSRKESELPVSIYIQVQLDSST